MRRRIDPEPELLRLPTYQSGVLSTEQTIGFGLPPRSVERLVASGHGQRLGRGLYFVHGQQPPWEALAWAGVLLVDPVLDSETASRPRLRHRKLLMQLLGDVGEGAESPLELRYLRDVERPHQLPRGRRQVVAGYGNYRHDVRYDRFRLVVELDGRIGHDGVSAFRDMNRDNAGVLAGTATLRYGWLDTLERPCPMAFQIGSVLVVLGGNDRPTRCPRCRDVPESDLL